MGAGEIAILATLVSAEPAVRWSAVDRTIELLNSCRGDAIHQTFRLTERLGSALDVELSRRAGT